VTADGEELPWNLDTLRDLAMFLTVDANGNDATMAAFDPNQVVQWGFGICDRHPRPPLDVRRRQLRRRGRQRRDPRALGAGAQWLHDAMWKDHFYPNGPYAAAPTSSVEPVHDGQPGHGADPPLVPGLLHVRPAGRVGPGPHARAFDGSITAKLHADTFAITSASRNPEAAFPRSRTSSRPRSRPA
jgi:multiple sugar transport system substrate-binding protein